LHGKLKLQCSKNHQYNTATYGSFYMGNRCPMCNRIKLSSKGEKEVFNVVKQITNEIIIENDRTQILNPLTGRNLELDIWIPSLNKAIEYNGTYWHSLPDKKQNDKEKIKQCKEKGIDLLIITDDEWNNNKSTYKEKIEDWI